MFACDLRSKTALLVVCRRRHSSECHANYKVSIADRFCPQNWLPWQRPVRDRKKITSDRSSTPKFYQSCIFREDRSRSKGKGSRYSITESRIPELIPVLGSQPAGDVSHRPGGRLPLLSARPAVTPQPLRGLLPILLLGEQRHNGCKQFA